MNKVLYRVVLLLNAYDFHFGAVLTSLFGECIQNSDLKYSVFFNETEKRLLHIYMKVLGPILAIFLEEYYIY